MSRDPKLIEEYIVNALKNNHPMTRVGLIQKVAMDVSNGESVDNLIEWVIDQMVGSFRILEEAHGKTIRYRLNE